MYFKVKVMQLLLWYHHPIVPGDAVRWGPSSCELPICDQHYQAAVHLCVCVPK